MKQKNLSRRDFLLQASGGALVAAAAPATLTSALSKKNPVGAHLWVYASAFPPDWDCTPKLEEIFSDLSYAGIEGLEVMEVLLRRPDNATRLLELSKHYKVPVLGTSYSANMWDKARQSEILEDVARVAEQLQKCGGKTFGISVGTPGRKKTEDELDTQAKTLAEVYATCKKRGVVANLHNHTYEVENELHDLRGTLQRLPDSKLGPDLAWLVRAGVDPVWFVREYRKNIVYIHLRDQDSSNQWTEAMGEGIIDFDSIANALHEIRYKGPVTIELAFPRGFTPTRPLKESWKISRNLVTKKFGW
jgi:sugar phosphate isomerase/epimerase